MRECDAKTIAEEPISGIDLMERASRGIYNKLIPELNARQKIAIVCGPGNNGGDGLCIALMLLRDGFDVKIYRTIFGKNISADHTFYYQLLMQYKADLVQDIEDPNQLDFEKCDIVLDAIFGTGMQHIATDLFLKCIQIINNFSGTVYSIDMPSGLLDKGFQPYNSFVHSKITYTIEAPKPSFFYPENKISFRIANAGIKIKDAPTEEYFLSAEAQHIKNILRAIPQKPEHGHKGNSGHVLLIGGNNGMHGAIALAANSCIQHGAGLTTAFAPAGAKLYLANIPKAMHIAKKLIVENAFHVNDKNFTTLAIGPGLGLDSESTEFLKIILKTWNKPVILDADALNILAENEGFWKYVLPGSILTPHPGEFTRLFGIFNHTSDKFQKAREVCQSKQIYILAKDKYSALICPDGSIVFNGSGGPELSQGGSGDTLTGAIAAWMARTSDPKMACMAAMYLCGLGETV